ncbi:MAG: hypothetical protein QM767_13100 [Anaeromyxobacter sp.]
MSTPVPLSVLAAPADHSLALDWRAGHEGEPLYRALLVSPSREAARNGLDPSWGTAVVTPGEYQGALAAVERNGFDWEDGEPPSGARGYVARVDAGGRVAHAQLGADGRTLRALETIGLALQPAHRGLMDRVVRRARVALHTLP